MSNIFDYFEYWKNSKTDHHNRSDLLTKINFRIRKLIP